MAVPEGDGRHRARCPLLPDKGAAVGRRSFFLALCCAWTGWGLAASPGLGILSGSTSVSLTGFPLPCTIVDEIKLDTPCERTVFAWDLELGIVLKCSFDPLTVTLDTVFGIPGFEYVVAGLNGKWGAFTLNSELCFAVPYESVIDVNNLPNMAVIPPGDLLFAQLRVEAAGSFSGVAIRWIAVFQDINFPNPGADYNPPGAPDYYRASDQNFALGSVITLSSDLAPGVPLTIQMCLGAEPGSFSVKKHSTSGKANPDAMYLTISLSNIPFPCPWCGGPFSNLRLGISARIQPKDNPATPYTDPFISLTGSASLTLFEKANVSTSFTLGITTGITWGGISVNVPTDFGTINLQFDSSGGFSGASIYFSYRHQFSYGPTSGSCSASATATLDKGVTGASLALSLNQGLFTSSYGLSYALRSDKGLSFAGLNVRFGLNLSPVQIGFLLVFGRGGLAQFGVTIGYVF